MGKKNIDIPKIIVGCIIAFICLVLIISLFIYQAEKRSKSDLYKNETYISEIFDSYTETLEKLTNNDFYLYDNEEISIFNYNNNGIRYYDGIHQKDNDITKLIPKQFFFAINPNGKLYVGEKYGFYIKTIKDLEETKLDSASYNSNNYYKSVVIVFAYDSLMPSYINNNYSGYTNIALVESAEFHSYKMISAEKKDELSTEIENDILNNGVVTYYNDLDDDKIFIESYKYQLSLTNDYGEISNNDYFYNYGNTITATSNTAYQYFEIVVNENNDLRNNMRLIVNYKFDIIDAVWLEDTKRAETRNKVEIKKEHTYTYKYTDVTINNKYDLTFGNTLNNINLKCIGNGKNVVIECSDNNDIIVSYIIDGNVAYLEQKKDNNNNNNYYYYEFIEGIEYLISINKNEQSNIKVNIYSEE